MKNLDKWDKLVLTIGGGLSILLFVDYILICIGDSYMRMYNELSFFCCFSLAFGATTLYFAIKQIYIISGKSTAALVISIVLAAALLCYAFWILVGWWGIDIYC